MLQLFAEKQGLSRLLSVLFGKLEEVEEETPPENRTKLCRISQWKNWLMELSAYIHIPNYLHLFINSPACSLLFKLLRGISMGDELDESKENFQSLLFEPIEVPVFWMYLMYQSILFVLLERAGTEGDSTIWKAVHKTGALELTLIRLSALAAVDHRNPRWFERFYQVKIPDCGSHNHKVDRNAKNKGSPRERKETK